MKVWSISGNWGSKDKICVFIARKLFGSFKEVSYHRTELILSQFICDNFLTMQRLSNERMRLLIFEVEVARVFLIILDVLSFASAQRCPNVLLAS
jgi:hypothetical protein